MKTLPLFLFPALLLFCACKKEPGTTPDETPINLTEYPLAIGNKWTYHLLYTSIDSTTTQFTSFDLDWEITGDTTIASTHSFKTLQHVYLQNDDSVNYRSFMYYANANSAFYKTGVEGTDPFIQFKDEPGPPAVTGFIGIPAPNTTGFIQLLSPYAVLLKFPVQVNESWKSHEYPYNFYSSRKWVGYETITTKAGTFNCARVEVITDYDDDGILDEGQPVVYQYFSTKGLIRESYNHQFVSNGKLGQRIRSIDLVAVNF